jgi:hypothetical protein
MASDLAISPVLTQTLGSRHSILIYCHIFTPFFNILVIAHQNLRFWIRAISYQPSALRCAQSNEPVELLSVKGFKNKWLADS